MLFSPTFPYPCQADDRKSRNTLRPLMTPVLALALAACGADTGPASDMAVEDSAGVRIVQHTGIPDVEPPFAFAPEPVYRHGSGPGQHMFASIWGGVLLSDGSAAVFDAGTADVVVLGPDGTFRSVLASRGEGPGDVGFVVSMYALGGDSLLLEDNGNSRFALFAGATLARTTRIPPAVSYAFRTHGIDADGRMLMSSSSYRRGFPDEWLPGYMVRFDPETEVADTVATYDWVPFRPPEGTPENPFSHYGIVGAAGGEFLYGRSDTPELTWRRSDGSVRQIVRWEPEWVYPTEEHWDVFAADLRETAPEHNPQAGTEEAKEALVTSMLARYSLEPDEPLPLFTPPIADDAGRVWLGAFSVSYGRGAAPSFTIFSPEGHLLGSLNVPDGMRVLDVAGGRVLGVVMDEMDVESVVAWELAEAN